MKKKVWLVDVDGTLALRTDRSPFEWHRVGEDLPNGVVVDLVKTLEQFTEAEIIVVSGRDDVCRDQTAQWLDALGIRYVDLLMRKHGDHRADQIVKKEIFEQHIAGKFDVVGVIDDRNKVVKMWREELGLTCLQVADGDF